MKKYFTDGSLMFMAMPFALLLSYACTHTCTHNYTHTHTHTHTHVHTRTNVHTHTHTHLQIWMLTGGLVGVQLAALVITPPRGVSVALSLLSSLLKLALVLYLPLCIIGERWMAPLLSAFLLAVFLIVTVMQILAWLLIAVVFTFAQLSLVYGMVWLLVKVMEVVLTPCGLSVWVQPVSKGLLSVVHLVWSIVLRTLGPSVIQGLRAIGGGSQDGSSSLEQEPEEEVDLPVSEPSLDSLSLQPQQKITRFTNVKMPPSALRHRTPFSTLQSSWSTSGKENEGEEHCQSWSASLRSESLRRISVHFADKLEECVFEDESAGEDEKEDVDGHLARNVQLEDEGYSPGDELSGFGTDGRSGVKGRDHPWQSSTSEESDSEQVILNCNITAPHTKEKSSQLVGATCHRGGHTQGRVPPKEAAAHRVRTIFQVLAGAFVLTLFLTHNWTALLFVVMMAWIMVKSVMGGLVEASLARVWSCLQMAAARNIPSPLKKIYLLLDRKVCACVCVCLISLCMCPFVCCRLCICINHPMCLHLIS